MVFGPQVCEGILIGVRVLGDFFPQVRQLLAADSENGDYVEMEKGLVEVCAVKQRKLVQCVYLVADAS